MRSWQHATSSYGILAQSSEETRPAGPPAVHGGGPGPSLAVRESGLEWSEKEINLGRGQFRPPGALAYSIQQLSEGLASPDAEASRAEITAANGMVALLPSRHCHPTRSSR